MKCLYFSVTFTYSFSKKLGFLLKLACTIMKSTYKYNNLGNYYQENNGRC